MSQVEILSVHRLARAGRRFSPHENGLCWVLRGSPKTESCADFGEKGSYQQDHCYTHVVHTHPIKAAIPPYKSGTAADTSSTPPNIPYGKYAYKE